MILRRPVDLVIDMNVYEDNRWGEKERREADQARQKAYESGIPYIELANYPLKEIIECFDTDYFTNTVDYALALSIYRGFTQIDLYGVNMAWGSEYFYQKPGVEYWVGRAQGQGIKVNVHGERSTILKTKDGLLYGYGIKQRRQ